MSNSFNKNNNSAVLRSFARIAAEKKLVDFNDNQITKQAAVKEDLTAGENVIENILKLAKALRARGNVVQADELEFNVLSYKAASNDLYQVSKETGEDLINQAHPGGSLKLKDTAGDCVVETILDQHKKIKEIVQKQPTGKLAMLRAEIANLEKSAALIIPIAYVLFNANSDALKVSYGLKKDAAALAELIYNVITSKLGKITFKMADHEITFLNKMKDKITAIENIADKFVSLEGKQELDENDLSIINQYSLLSSSLLNDKIYSLSNLKSTAERIHARESEESSILYRATTKLIPSDMQNIANKAAILSSSLEKANAILLSADVKAALDKSKQQQAVSAQGQLPSNEAEIEYNKLANYVKEMNETWKPIVDAGVGFKPEEKKYALEWINEANTTENDAGNLIKKIKSYKQLNARSLQLVKELNKNFETFYNEYIK